PSCVPVQGSYPGYVRTSRSEDHLQFQKDASLSAVDIDIDDDVTSSLNTLLDTRPDSGGNVTSFNTRPDNGSSNTNHEKDRIVWTYNAPVSSPSPSCTSSSEDTSPQRSLSPQSPTSVSSSVMSSNSSSRKGPVLAGGDALVSLQPNGELSQSEAISNISSPDYQEEETLDILSARDLMEVSDPSDSDSTLLVSDRTPAAPTNNPTKQHASGVASLSCKTRLPVTETLGFKSRRVFFHDWIPTPPTNAECVKLLDLESISEQNLLLRRQQLLVTGCQAIVVGFLGSVVAIVMGGIKSYSVELDHAFLLCASSLVTSSLASFVLGLITAAVIVFSRHCKINPDNVATPIAASLGDITSLALLSWISTVLYDAIGKEDWLAPLIIAGYILITPLWVWIAKKNEHTREVLHSGWTPVMAAMLISRSNKGGLILDFMVSRFEGIAVFQPVINGVGGNLVAVQASRISTALHREEELGKLANEDTVIFITPKAGFFGKGVHARTARVLMLMVIPGHLIFIYTINYMKAGHISLTPLFVFVYLCASTLQVATLLYIAYIMIHWMWKRNVDPDNSAIPYLTSLGDLLGISLLAIGFHFLYLVGDRDAQLDI
ncbi:unnamed protein product, partial [Timema podura]|nr:unnamed protein product [Timema podura]